MSIFYSVFVNEYSLKIKAFKVLKLFHPDLTVLTNYNFIIIISISTITWSY